MSNGPLKVWRRQLHELQRRKNELASAIKAARLLPDVPESEQQLRILEAERTLVLSEIEKHKEAGQRAGFTLSGTEAKGRRGARSKFRLMTPTKRATTVPTETRERLTRQLKEINSELKRLLPGFHHSRIEELRKEKRKLVRELRKSESRASETIWRSWSKGPGKVRFWRGR